jgi:hypothetical protein
MITTTQAVMDIETFFHRPSTQAPCRRSIAGRLLVLRFLDRMRLSERRVLFRDLDQSAVIRVSTVDDSFAPGIGKQLDGWANRDLDVGAVIGLAPDFAPVTKLLGVDGTTLHKVLASWGPGRFDAQVFLDGKAVRPDGRTAATLIPPAFGLGGVRSSTTS